MGIMIHLLLSSDSSYVLFIILGFIFIFFILPFIMGAAFDKAEKEADKGNGSCLGIIIALVLILAVVGCILQLKDCSENHNYHRSPEYRHTYIPHKPMQSFVKTFIFNT